MLWLPTIVKHGAAIGIGATGLLTALPYLIACGLMMAVSVASDRLQQRERFVWPFLLLAGISFLASWLLAGVSFWIAYVCLAVAGACMYAPCGPFFALIPEQVPRPVAGQTIGLVKGAGALGGFVGSWGVGWLNATLSPQAAFLAMAAILIVAGITGRALPGGN
ncbi:MAG: MFS transporter [Candidatus Xenobia bacterium]